jgi:hypothetical protein
MKDPKQAEIHSREFSIERGSTDNSNSASPPTIADLRAISKQETGFRSSVVG